MCTFDIYTHNYLLRNNNLYNRIYQAPKTVTINLQNLSEI